MASSEGCSPYALSVGILIGIFIGREDSPEFDQVCDVQQGATPVSIL